MPAARRSSSCHPRIPLLRRTLTLPKSVRASAYAFARARTRERYWLYSLLFALTLVTTCLVGAAMQSDFERNVPFDLERSLELWGVLLEASRRPPARPAVFPHPAADSAGPRVRPLRRGRLPSRGCQPAVLSALADPGNLRRLHPRSLAHLLQARALRYRDRRTAGRLRLSGAGAGRRASPSPK